jgi:hypothetical protein
VPAVSTTDRSRLWAYLFIAGGIAGLLQLYFLGFSFTNGTELFDEAKSLALHGTFADPYFIANTGPTAANPPLYPFFLALMMKLISPSFVALVVVICGILANALVAGFLPRISRVIYGEEMPGVVAAFLWLAASQLSPEWDTSFTVVGLIAFCLFTERTIGKESSSMHMWILAGAAAGLLCLTNLSTVLVSLPWTAFLIFRRKGSFGQAVSVGGVFLAGLILVTSVWALRNLRQLGAPVLRTGFGLALYASNNDCARSSLLDTWYWGCLQSHHPNTNLNDALLIRQIGEVAYDNKRMADAKDWVLANPAKFRWLTVQRVWEFWFPTRDHQPSHQNVYTTYAIWLATGLSIPGLLLMIRKRTPLVGFFVIVLLIYPLMYYVLVSDARYRYPVLWVSLLPAGYFVCAIMPRRSRRADPVIAGSLRQPILSD